MKIIKKWINRWKYLPVILIVTVFAAALFSEPRLMAQGVRDGLSLCAQIVIPSLFPFMVLCTFFIKSGLCSVIGKYAAPLSKKIFKLPGVAAGVILMSLVGGFPVGAKMTAQLLERGEISQNSAQRMMMFCVNAGPAFVIGAVGSSMLGSRKAGVIIFISLCISSLFVGWLTRFIADNSESEIKQSAVKMRDVQKSIVESVADSTGAMLMVCSWIILFSCICSLIALLPSKYSILSVPLKCFFEVTTGSAAAVKAGINIAAITGIIGWSGLSVHCQVLEYVKRVGMKTSVFRTARATNGALAAVISYEIFKFFPCDISAFATTTQPIIASYSSYVPACIGLFLMGALLILDLDMNKKMC